MKRFWTLIVSMFLMMALCLTGCGGSKADSAQKADSGAGALKEIPDPNLGLYRVEGMMGMTAEELAPILGGGDIEAFRNSFSMELKEGGKGTFTAEDEPAEVFWSMDGDTITIAEKENPGENDEVLKGTVIDGVMTLDMEGETLILAKAGSEAKAVEQIKASGGDNPLAALLGEVNGMTETAEESSAAETEAGETTAAETTAAETTAAETKKAGEVKTGAESSGDLGKYTIYEYEANGQKVGHDMLVTAGMGDTYLELKEDGKADFYLFNQKVDVTWEPGTLIAYGTSKWPFKIDGDTLTLDMAGVTYIMKKDGSASSGGAAAADTGKTGGQSAAGAAALDSDLEIQHGLYTVKYPSAAYRKAEASEFGDLVNIADGTKIYITSLEGDLVKEKIEALNGYGGETEEIDVAGGKATVWRYEDWLGPQCEMILTLPENVEAGGGYSMDAVYIYTSGDTKDQVWNDDIKAIMQSVEITGKKGESKAEETTAAETAAAPAGAEGGEGIISDEAVKKGYVYLDEILDSKAFDMTYEDLVEYFGAEGQFDKEEYSEHMKANYRYYKWISDQDPNTFIYINLKEKDGVYKVSGFNSSGFTATQAKDEYLAVLQEEEKEKSKAAAANMKMNDVTMELKTFGSGGTPLDVKVQIPEKEWSQEVKNGTGKIYNTEDLSKTFGVGFIQLKVDKDIAKFDFYKDKFENYKEIEPRVIGGVEMQGRTYKNIGYEWTEYIGQANDELAISIGIVRVDIDEGTLGDKILDSISFE